MADGGGGGQPPSFKGIWTVDTIPIQERRLYFTCRKVDIYIYIGWNKLFSHIPVSPDNYEVIIAVKNGSKHRGKNIEMRKRGKMRRNWAKIVYPCFLSEISFPSDPQLGRVVNGLKFKIYTPVTSKGKFKVAWYKDYL